MSAQPTAAEIADRFVNGADLTYAQRAALVQGGQR